MLSLSRPNTEETALLVHLIVFSGNMTSTAYAFHGYAVQWSSRPTDIPLHSVHAMIALRMYVRTLVAVLVHSCPLIKPSVSVRT